MQNDDGFESLRGEKRMDGWGEADIAALIDSMKQDPMRFVKACEYCGGPDHAIGLCHAVAAVEYRNGDVVKRVEFNRDAAFMKAAAQVDWLDVRVGVMGAEAKG